MINFQTAKINTIQMNTNFRSKEQSQVGNADGKVVESLDNPMETVGRSQVNFKSAKQLIKSLSSEELNIIAEYAAKSQLSAQEIKVGKQALIDTMNEYGYTSVDKLARKINKSFASLKTDKPNNIGEKILGDLEKNVMKIDSNVNVNRASSIIDDFIINTF